MELTRCERVEIDHYQTITIDSKFCADMATAINRQLGMNLIAGVEPETVIAIYNEGKYDPFYDITVHYLTKYSPHHYTTTAAEMIFEYVNCALSEADDEFDYDSIEYLDDSHYYVDGREI